MIDFTISKKKTDRFYYFRLKGKSNGNRFCHKLRISLLVALIFSWEVICFAFFEIFAGVLSDVKQLERDFGRWISKKVLKKENLSMLKKYINLIEPKSE